ncbi:MAG: hypothetical protein IPF99_27065 [Deltaproteobacteria bacterium]|nr:hypothetical protein [Deltaproteobacteria bacterium]
MEGRGCRENNECCSGLSCQSNVCRRAPMDGGTGSDGGGINIDIPRIDGAAGDARVDSATGDGGMCIAAGSLCVQGSTACCGDYSCGAQPGGTFCCRPAMGACSTSRECCGSMLCTNGACVCRRREESCSANLDCCGGARCNIAMGASSEHVRLQPGLRELHLQ